jgi:hypothetical protein
MSHNKELMLVSVSDIYFMGSCARVVNHTEYPSLVDLRGLLLDLVAQLLGALSRIRSIIFFWMCFLFLCRFLQTVSLDD